MKDRKEANEAREAKAAEHYRKRAMKKAVEKLKDYSDMSKTVTPPSKSAMSKASSRSADLSKYEWDAEQKEKPKGKISKSKNVESAGPVTRSRGRPAKPEGSGIQHHTHHGFV